jgi:diacylglycerol kinase family enzyme
MTTGVLLLHHPGAGDDDRDQAERERLIELVERHGLGPVEYRQWSDELAPLVELDDRLVVVSGGDGTVAPVLLAGAGRRHPIGILPSGTANNIARSLGIAVDDLHRAARTLIAGAVPFDLPVASTPDDRRGFTESVTVGVFAELLAEGDRRGDLDLHEARRLLVDVLTAATPTRASVEVDGTVREGSFLGIQVMNIGRAGPGVVVAAGARVGDGRATVVVLEEAERDLILEALAQDSDADVSVALPEWDGEVVTVRSPEPVAMTVDDALLASHEAITVSYRDRATVPVLAP